MSTVHEIAQSLVDLCKQGKNQEAMAKWYADDIESIESAPWQDQPRQVNGIDAVNAKSQWWYENNEMHGGDVQGPFLHGDDQFAAVFMMDVTPKGMERMQMTEVAVYTVANGKIIREQFFAPPMG